MNTRVTGLPKKNNPFIYIIIAAENGEQLSAKKSTREIVVTNITE